MELELRINGMIKSLNVAANESLLTALRREGYCSVKSGCETGECGACAVLVDGVPRPSCVTLAAQVGGCTLTTVEYLGSARQLHPLQQAFVDVGAVQCGFCTSGMLVSAYALLQNNQNPTEDEVRDALSGNLCRCTGYIKPVQAVLRAAEIMRGEKVAPIEYRTVNFTAENVVSSTGKESVMLAVDSVQAREALWATAGSTTKLPVVSAGVSAVLPTETHVDSRWQVVGKPVPDVDCGQVCDWSIYLCW